LKKKNQHYVPKFYLRKFALANTDRNLICLYNIATDRFIEKANIKNQASAPYYYGEDLIAENYLSDYEGIFAQTLKDIEEGKLPDRVTSDVEVTAETFTLSKEWSSLMYFVLITDLRNPVRKDQYEAMTDNLIKQMLREHPEFTNNMHIINQFKIVPANTPKEILYYIESLIQILADLNYKLLVNHTTVPFITSDNPVVRYNQWLDKFNKRQTSGGYGSVGTQIFIPINDRLQIMVYDEDIYRIGKPKHQIVNVIHKRDINQLNVLQFLNSYSNVFGNERMSAQYVQTIKDLARAFPKPNKVQTGSLGHIYRQTNTGLKTNLSLSFSSFTQYALNFPFDDRMMYYRPHVQRIKKKEKQAETN